MTKFNATSIQQHQAARLLNQDYRKTGQNILGDGLKLCRRAKAHNSTNPTIAYIAVTSRPGGSMAQMHDVAKCGNAHLCSFCSGCKAAHMRDWIMEMFIPAAKKRGLILGLMTLTAHHRRECDWAEFVKRFYLALEAFGKTMRRSFKVTGSFGRVRAMECPVGANGLHIHIHDLFTYAPGADIDALGVLALAKWKSALRKFGLHCSKRGVDVKKYGEFDPLYIAKEMASHDTKTNSKSDLVSLFKLLDKSARGNIEAGKDWIRAAKAIQGRDRWNVGQLANKLGIPCPSDWKRPEMLTNGPDKPIQLIEYPQAHHMVATSPNSDRAGLAFVLRAARNEATRPGAVQAMALRMCEETIKCKVELIKDAHAYKLAEALAAIDRMRLTESAKADHKEALAAKHFSHCTFAIADYQATTYQYMHAAPTPAPSAITAPTATALIAGMELDFA